MKSAFALIGFAMTLMPGLALADGNTPCPSDIVKPFVGKWQGHAVLLPAQAEQQQMGTRAEFEINDCQSFTATFNYLDSTGNIIRTVKFNASPDSQHAGLFAIENGTTTDSTGVTNMSGSFRQIQNGTLLGTFFGALGGQPVYMTELMNATAPDNGPGHLVRTVQMFSKQGGSYIASRVVDDTKVQ